MTGTENGWISIWRNGRFSKSIDCKGEGPLIKVVDQDIIVASFASTSNGKLLVLDTTLKVKKEYNTINYWPLCLSATGKYIAIGTVGGEVTFFDRNGSTKPTVRTKLRK